MNRRILQRARRLLRRHDKGSGGTLPAPVESEACGRSEATFSTARVAASETSGEVPALRLRRDLCATVKALHCEDIAQLLQELGSLPVTDFQTLVAEADRSGVGLRLDLSRGLTESTTFALDQLGGLARQTWVLLPVAASGDLGYARQGRFLVAKDAATALAEICKRYQCKLGFLADPAAIIGRVLNSPVLTWPDVRQQLSARGVSISGMATSFHQSPAHVLEMIWMARATGRLANRDYLAQLQELGYESREWLFEQLNYGDAEFQKPHDGIRQVRLHREPSGELHFMRTLDVRCQARYTCQVHPSLDCIIYSEPSGWKLLDEQGHGRSLTTSEVVEFIKRAAPLQRVGLVLDPADVDWGCRPKKSSTNNKCVVRPLPYPFHHYLSVNSDVDWSTHSHIERAAEYVCDELGMSLSGSLYTTSRDSRWPAWEVLANPNAKHDERHNKTARALHEGLFDTLHGIAYTFNSRVMHVDRRLKNAPLALHLDAPWSLECDEALMVVTTLSQNSPAVEVITADGPYCFQLRNRSDDPELSCSYHVYDPAIEPGAAPVTFGRLRCTGTDKRVNLLRIETIVADKSRIQDMIEHCEQRRLTLPVFTAHGGGADTRRLGSCVEADWEPPIMQEREFAIDRPSSPFYCLPALRKAGVRFFNPIGLYFSVPNAFHICELLRFERAQDGSPVATFPRFYSQRYLESGESAYWSYGKHGATGEGLAGNIEDLLLQLAWSEPGHGAIIYTHLGHRVGNQLANRLGWNEEALAAWSRLSHYHSACDRTLPTPFRLWVAPAAQILAFAAVQRRLEDHTSIDGTCVRITSWIDEALGHRIPDPERYGTSWLHGVTIYVPSPETATVEVDGVSVPHFTRNQPDELGGSSITLVHADNCIPLLHSPTAIPVDCAIRLSQASAVSPVEIAIENPQTSTVQRLPIHPTSLRNVSHWTFEVTGVLQDEQWAVGFETEDGQVYLAGAHDGAQWPVASGNSAGWQRYTFAFCEARAALVPRGRVAAIILQGNVAGPCRFAVRDLSLIRPRACDTRGGGSRTLTGRVYDVTTSRPMAGVNIRCRRRDDMLICRTNDAGVYEFNDLPDSYRCELSIDDAEVVYSRFLRGSIAYMVCDYWDWDIAAAAA